MELQIIQDSKLKSTIRIFLAILTTVSLIIVIYSDYLSIKSINVFFLPYYIIILGGEYFLHKKVGHLSLNNDNIEIKKLDEDNETILHSDIKELKLYVKKSTYFFFQTVFVYNIIIVLNNEKEKLLVISFLRKNKQKFLSVLKNYYKKEINVKEFGENGDRQFLKKSNLSYKEIQEIKKEYKITW